MPALHTAVLLPIAVGWFKLIFIPSRASELAFPGLFSAWDRTEHEFIPCGGIKHNVCISGAAEVTAVMCIKKE